MIKQPHDELYDVNAAHYGELYDLNAAHYGELYDVNTPRYGKLYDEYTDKAVNWSSTTDVCREVV